MDWQQTYAALWRPKSSRLKSVSALDPIRFDDLIGIERQKAAFIENTERFLHERPSNNVLLWGARGTGKSSLIKAALNAYAPLGLRVVEIDRDDLDDLVEIADLLREEPYRFIVFCDDLSFEQGERGYKGLKRILEGSIEMPPSNMRIYATSNRRHLISEYHADNIGTRVGDNGEIHYGDSVEEKIALSDRFGLWLSFYSSDQAEYLRLVDHYFKGYGGDIDELHRAALRFAQSRASKSARTAKQFYNSGYM